MAQRITGDFADFKRVTFVKGWLTGGTDPADGSVEVGDGTPFPLIATGAGVAQKLDRLAEVLYRVRESRWASGSSTMNYTGESGMTYSGTLTFRDVSYGSTLVETEVDSDTYAYQASLTRSYSTTVVLADAEDPTEPMDGSSFFQPSYEIEFPVIWGDTQFYRAKDIADNEYGMWDSNDPTAFPPTCGTYDHAPLWIETSSSQREEFKTGYSYEGLSDQDTSVESSSINIHVPIAYVVDDGAETSGYRGTALVALAFSGLVAYVSPSGSIFDPDVEFYIGCELYVSHSDHTVLFEVQNSWDTTSFSTNKSSISDPDDTGALLKLKLADESYLTAKIYGIYSPTSEVESYRQFGSVSDFVIEPTLWWPYATKAATPAWNTTTGAPANGGPAA
jgi:hypothetical protein